MSFCIESFSKDRGALDVAGNKLLALFVMEGGTHPDAKASMILRGNLCHGRVGQELSLVELSEHPSPVP